MKFRYDINEKVKVLESGIVGKVIDTSSIDPLTPVYKIKGYEEMWFREDELIKD